MNEISLIRHPDWRGEIKYWRTEVLNICASNYRLLQIQEMTLEEVNKLIDFYLPVQDKFNFYK